MYKLWILLYVSVSMVIDATQSESPKKREIGHGGGNQGFGGGFDYEDGGQGFEVVNVQPVHLVQPVSQAEAAHIATAVTTAQHAVNLATQRVREAAHTVLMQQHLAKLKEQEAQQAIQKSEAAAQAQKQEAKAAATAVILAQQKLAQAKAELAEHQKIAAYKENQAALAIHRSASAAAAQIQKAEAAAAKLAALKGFEQLSFKQAAAAKDASLQSSSPAVEESLRSGTHGKVWVHPHPHIHWG